MGILPLEFLAGDTPKRLGLTGEETFSFTGIAQHAHPGGQLEVVARGASGEERFRVRVRIDTPDEAEYYRHGGILQYVLRQLHTNGG